MDLADGPPTTRLTPVPEGAAPPVPMSTPRNRPRILLLADGRENAFAPLLEDAGFAVTLRTPDDVAATEAVAVTPSLVVGDLSPRDPRALRFTRQLAGALASFAPPVILLSDDADDDAVQKAFAAGVRDIISKPVLPAVLRVKLRQLARTAPEERRWIADYFVKSVIGRGGMGTVYLAEQFDHEHRAPVATVALKVVETAAVESTPELLARFTRETHALRSIAGEGIPRFVETGRTRDLFYYAMEYVPGPSLDRALREHGALPSRSVERILLNVANALGLVHELGLVHRDVKPANVILAPDGRAWLVDLGLAKEVNDFSLTCRTEILGTAGYLAPEVASGAAADARSDAFALGMTALEAALGESPLTGTPYQIIVELSQGKVPSPAALLPGACPTLVSVLGGLVAVSPDERLPLGELPARLAGCCGSKAAGP